MDIDRVVFEDLFAGSDDPWGFRTRWYESRKRALTLACLPAARYARAFEPGCANGELTAALATRCDQVLASDGVAAAVLLAQQRLNGLGLTNVSVAQAWVPQDWPAQTFDLIVFSEFGLQRAVDGIAVQLEAGDGMAPMAGQQGAAGAE